MVDRNKTNMELIHIISNTSDRDLEIFNMLHNGLLVKTGKAIRKDMLYSLTMAMIEENIYAKSVQENDEQHSEVVQTA